jgi:hypothetical protein
MYTLSVHIVGRNAKFELNLAEGAANTTVGAVKKLIEEKHPNLPADDQVSVGDCSAIALPISLSCTHFLHLQDASSLHSLILFPLCFSSLHSQHYTSRTDYHKVIIARGKVARNEDTVESLHLGPNHVLYIGHEQPHHRGHAGHHHHHHHHGHHSSTGELFYQ